MNGIRQGNTCRPVRISTNVSSGLSAIAEFLALNARCCNSAVRMIDHLHFKQEDSRYIQPEIFYLDDGRRTSIIMPLAD